MPLQLALLGVCAHRVRGVMGRSPRPMTRESGQTYTLALDGGGKVEIDVPLTENAELMPSMATEYLLGVDAILFAIYTGDAETARRTLALVNAVRACPHLWAIPTLLMLFDNNGPQSRSGSRVTAPRTPCEPGTFAEYAEARGAYRGTIALVREEDIHAALCAFVLPVIDLPDEPPPAILVDGATLPRHTAAPLIESATTPLRSDSARSGGSDVALRSDSVRSACASSLSVSPRSAASLDSGRSSSSPREDGSPRQADAKHHCLVQ